MNRGLAIVATIGAGLAAGAVGLFFGDALDDSSGSSSDIATLIVVDDAIQLLPIDTPTAVPADAITGPLAVSVGPTLIFDLDETDPTAAAPSAVSAEDAQSYHDTVNELLDAGTELVDVNAVFAGESQPDADRAAADVSTRVPVSLSDVANMTAIEPRGLWVLDDRAVRDPCTDEEAPNGCPGGVVADVVGTTSVRVPDMAPLTVAVRTLDNYEGFRCQSNVPDLEGVQSIIVLTSGPADLTISVHGPTGPFEVATTFDAAPEGSSEYDLWTQRVADGTIANHDADRLVQSCVVLDDLDPLTTHILKVEAVNTEGERANAGLLLVPDDAETGPQPRFYTESTPGSSGHIGVDVALRLDDRAVVGYFDLAIGGSCETLASNIGDGGLTRGLSHPVATGTMSLLSQRLPDVDIDGEYDRVSIFSLRVTPGTSYGVCLFTFTVDGPSGSPRLQPTHLSIVRPDGGFSATVEPRQISVLQPISGGSFVWNTEQCTSSSVLNLGAFANQVGARGTAFRSCDVPELGIVHGTIAVPDNRDVDVSIGARSLAPCSTMCTNDDSTWFYAPIPGPGGCLNSGCVAGYLAFETHYIDADPLGSSVTYFMPQNINMERADLPPIPRLMVTAYDSTQPRRLTADFLSDRPVAIEIMLLPRDERGNWGQDPPPLAGACSTEPVTFSWPNESTSHQFDTHNLCPGVVYDIQIRELADGAPVGDDLLSWDTASFNAIEFDAQVVDASVTLGNVVIDESAVTGLTVTPRLTIAGTALGGDTSASCTSADVPLQFASPGVTEVSSTITVAASFEFGLSIECGASIDRHGGARLTIDAQLALFNLDSNSSIALAQQPIVDVATGEQIGTADITMAIVISSDVPPPRSGPQPT